MNQIKGRWSCINRKYIKKRKKKKFSYSFFYFCRFSVLCYFSLFSKRKKNLLKFYLRAKNKWMKWDLQGNFGKIFKRFCIICIQLWRQVKVVEWISVFFAVEKLMSRVGILILLGFVRVFLGFVRFSSNLVWWVWLSYKTRSITKQVNS